MYHLGSFYYRKGERSFGKDQYPISIHKSYHEKALKLYKVAAEKGVKEAQYELGLMYDTGQFGCLEKHEPNYEEAKKWYLLAANQGDPWSELQLDFLSSEGHIDYNLERDVKAKMDVIASSGNPPIFVSLQP